MSLRDSSSPSWNLRVFEASTNSGPTVPLIGIDIGGTFTDACLWDGFMLRTAKAPTTPHDFVQGVLDALDQLDLSSLAAASTDRPWFDVVQGSTVATNALLERKGVRTAFLATAGFRDLLRIGRQNRPKLYDLHVCKPEPIIAHDACFEVGERIDSEGHILTPLDDAEAERVIQSIRDAGIESLAVCLLFSFLNPDHETRLAEMAEAAGLYVSTSAEILPEFREFERASTTAINAYVGPLMQRYLARLESALRERGSRQLRIMQSNGGQISARVAGRHAVRTILSGPAGGVVSAWQVARQLGEDHIISYDMGGTSTDVSLCVDTPAWSTTTNVDGWPIRVPMLDIETIGAGGGSIAQVDPAGALKVGPESAGADPGPACYGTSDRPTVTDANVVLGRIRPEFFLGGRMAIDPARSEAALDQLAARMNTDRITAALGVIRIANANMERAIKTVSAERGRDPRGCRLVSFGGAGGLHACELAMALGMKGVILPAHAGILSAYGMLLADIVRDYTRSIPQHTELEPRVLRAHFAEMMERAAADVQSDGYEQDDSVLERYADMRYRGQSHELTISVEFLNDLDALTAAFHDMHESRYGYADRAAPVEIVTLRTRCIVTTSKPHLPDRKPVHEVTPPSPEARHPVVFASDGKTARVETPFFAREALSPGVKAFGPAVVTESHATTLISPGWHWHIHPQGHIILVPDSDSGEGTRS